LALLKEILYDDDQLKNLINKSDSTLKAVQDFFRDGELIAPQTDNNHKNFTNKVIKIKLFFNKFYFF
jgi:hypothetical protein